MVVESLSGLLRVRRRGNDCDSTSDYGATPGIEQPTASFAMLGGEVQELEVLSNNQKPEKRSSVSLPCYPIKAFACFLIILASVVLHANNINSASSARDEHVIVVKGDMLLDVGLPLLRGVLHSVDRRFPRTVAFSQIDMLILSEMPYTKEFEHHSIPPGSPLITSVWFEPNSLQFIRGYNMSVCKPAHTWQSKSFPNCNMFHESNLLEMSLIASGTIRSVFELSENIDGNVNKFVYKNLNFDGKHSFTPRRVEQERKDGLILERTTRSQFIPSIQGYCSTTVIMEKAPRDMQQYNEIRLARDITVSNLDRLKIAIHIASGVADLHSVGFIHNDLHEQQFLFQDGLFKLNDFNFAKPMYVDVSTNETCTLSNFTMKLFGRSLEELQTELGYEGFTQVKPDKIDVWIMGNLLYTILTDLQVWDKELRSFKNVTLATAKRLVAGELPRIPQPIQNSSDPAHVAMKTALDMTWRYDSKERPSARSIANYLIGELRTITGEKTPDFRINYPEKGFQ
ncbi:hypothetical protein ACHAXM_007367 [Skeletonema potamos]